MHGLRGLIILRFQYVLWQSMEFIDLLKKINGFFNNCVGRDIPPLCHWAKYCFLCRPRNVFMKKHQAAEHQLSAHPVKYRVWRAFVCKWTFGWVWGVLTLDLESRVREWASLAPNMDRQICICIFIVFFSVLKWRSPRNSKIRVQIMAAAEQTNTWFFFRGTFAERTLCKSWWLAI